MTTLGRSETEVGKIERALQAKALPRAVNVLRLCIQYKNGSAAPEIFLQLKTTQRNQSGVDSVFPMLLPLKHLGSSPGRETNSTAVIAPPARRTGGKITTPVHYGQAWRG